MGFFRFIFLFTPPLFLSRVSAQSGDLSKDLATCSGCGNLTQSLQALANQGDDAFVNFVTPVLCDFVINSTGIDRDVCEGSIRKEGPVFARSLRELTVGSKTSDLLCLAVFGVCDYPPVAPYTIEFPSPKPNKDRPVPSCHTPIKIVQYSDVHIDPFYEAGSNTKCNKPICCRSYAPTDAPGNNTSPAGLYGDHSCDAPVSLEESMYAAIRKIVPDRKFSIFNGDIVDHAIWNTTQTQNAFVIQDTYGRMGPLGLVYGTVGNHEMDPTNAFPPKGMSKAISAQWVYDLVSSLWNPWIGEAGAATVKDIGAYSSRVPDTNLRIISLNTNMYYTQNYYLYEKELQRDPSGQLAWLVRELDLAEQAGERVYIIGHIPPGIPDTFRDASNSLDQIINRYSATIAALFFGHTHLDEFQLSYADCAARSARSAAAVSYVMPSMTPTSGNPAFRVYTVDPVTFAVLDATTYTADMSDPEFQTAPVWRRLYSARGAYGPLVSPPLPEGAELSPAWWHNVTEGFERDDGVFQEYISWKTRGWRNETCDETCKRTEICQLRAARAQDNCHVPVPGIGLFGKREEGGVTTESVRRDECGFSVMKEALGELAKHPEAVEELHRVALVARRRQVGGGDEKGRSF